MGNSIQRPIARFEDFEVHLETGEVWKAGRPLLFGQNELNESYIMAMKNFR
jgi:hypothetical protein